MPIDKKTANENSSKKAALESALKQIEKQH